MSERAAEVKRAREERGWTQAQLAKRLGVSQGYVSLLESGRRPVSDRLAPSLRRALELSAAALPLGDPTLSPDSLPGALSALGYEPFGYVRGRTHHPGDVLLSALRQDDLPSRVVEALPWLALRYQGELDWRPLMTQAKLHNLQNRLGYVLSLARSVARGRGDDPAATALGGLRDALEPARLAREDTLCRETMPQAERRFLRRERPDDARHWNLLTSLDLSQLPYAA